MSTKLNLAGLDVQLATIGHSIPGIDRQIHDNLFNLSNIYFNISYRASESQSHFNILTNKPIQHPGNIFNNGIEIGNLHLHNLFATKGKQLSGKTGSPFRSIIDIFNHLSHGILLFKLQNHNLTVSKYGCKNIIEIMSNPTCQNTNRFHFLGSKQLRL